MNIINRLISIAVMISILSGCVTLPYKEQGDLFPSPEPFIDDPQISRGEPNVVADSLGHYFFSLPEKLILWNWSMGNHDISPETEERIRIYLAENDLKEVKVRLNEYAPFSEWKRLTENQAVGAGWRYTAGTLTWLLYTVFPGRIFGGDHYNPFTNSISLYSDLPMVALHEAGHAKETAGIKYKGSEAMLRLIPLYPLLDEEYASSDALSYVAGQCNADLERSGYKLLYPAYGTYIAGEILVYIPGVKTAALLAGAIPGHIVGRVKAGEVEERTQTAESGELVCPLQSSKQPEEAAEHNQATES